jgi:glycosyltransferase involved in cell wall biosynthesis
LKVLYIHQYFKTRYEAGGTRSYEFARRWVQHGHAVTVLCGRTGDGGPGASSQVSRHTVDGIAFIAVPTPYSNYMSFPRRIAAFFSFMLRSTWVGLRQAGPLDIVFATSTPLTVGIPGYVISRVKRVPFVFEIRDLWPEAPIQLGALRNPVAIWLARWLERFLYRAAHHVVTLSPGMQDALVSMGVPQHKLSMIPNCSDVDIFRPQGPTPEIRARYGLEGKFVLAYSGAMGMANGLSVIVETARELQSQGATDIQFVLIGDGKERPHLEELAAQYDLYNVTFLKPLPKLELAEFMPLADICLTIFAPFPVLQTNSPNKMFDALALGRPVLINYGGWMQEVLERHQAGVAVPSNDPREIAESILALRSQPERLAEMGRNARRLAEEAYDREKLAQQLEDVLVAEHTRHLKGKA